MKKGRILLLIMVVILIALSIKNVQLSAEQNNANLALKDSLSLAMSDFGVDYNNMPDKDWKQYYYNEAMCNTYLATQLISLTTYDCNNDLGAALHNLYRLMEEDKYKSDIMKKSKFLYDNLFILSHNPMDKKSVDNIFKLTEKIRGEN